MNTARRSKQVTLVPDDGTSPIRIRFVAPAPSTCPKCGADRGAEPACRRCGLSAAHADGYAQRRDQVPAALEVAWKRALAGWTDHDRHDALLALIRRHDAWAWGAACYRDVARQRPHDRIATQYADRLRKALEATTLLQAGAREEERPYRATRRLLIAIGLVVGFGLAMTSMLRDSMSMTANATASSAPAPAAAPAAAPAPAPAP